MLSLYSACSNNSIRLPPLIPYLRNVLRLMCRGWSIVLGRLRLRILSLSIGRLLRRSSGSLSSRGRRDRTCGDLSLGIDGGRRVGGRGLLDRTCLNRRSRLRGDELSEKEALMLDDISWKRGCISFEILTSFSKSCPLLMSSRNEIPVPANSAAITWTVSAQVSEELVNPV